MGLMPFDAVIAAHHAEIHRYLRRVAPRASDADDLSQETFLRAYRAYRRLPGEANVRAWLFAIATNLCRNHHRSERRRSWAHAAERARRSVSTRSAPDGVDPESATISNETRALVEVTLARLPVKQRMAFTLRKLHDLDYDTIGRTLACSPDSARAHVFQALRKIRTTLNGARVAGEGAR